jgi:phage gpG-like protein
MITIEADQTKIQARLTTMPERVHSAIVRTVTSLRLEMEAKIKSKLSGDVLNVVTGNLRRSIHSETIDSTNSVVGREFSSGIPYAAIHEFGGKIEIPEITPVKAQALHFFAGGAEIFAKKVAAHTVTMPERSYMRSTLSDMAPQIVRDLRDAATGEAKK